MDIYGFILLYDPPEGNLYHIPPGCTKMLVYSDDAKTFREEDWDGHERRSDFSPHAWNHISLMGKYKLDIAVRASFPRYKDCKHATSLNAKGLLKDMDEGERDGAGKEVK